MKINCVFTLFLSVLSFFLQAQSVENWIAETEKQPVEKIYIHTDGENYFHGDTLWFKVYITDSRSGRLIPSPENVYINFIDDKGTPVNQMVLLAVNGQAAGRFSVADTLKPGNYLMQAYTSYLFNFGTDACFYKKISVSRVSGTARAQGNSNSENMVADVQFLPEGGILLENFTNLVAFKAVNRLGLGVELQGTVKDEKGALVTSFSTDYKGMGLLFLTPEPGKTYTARVDGFASFRYTFEPVKAGIKIQLVNHTTSEVIVNVAGNTEIIANDTFYLACMCRGEVLFYKAIAMDGINKVVKFGSKSLKPGINKLVLLDKNLKPVSDRLLFSRNLEMNELLIQINNQVYKSRSEIRLQVTDNKNLTEKDFSNLSVSVNLEQAIPGNGYSKNILSHFLVDSELNGFVESSADLFTDSEISSEAKLRLVMLTNGYSKYFWNGAPGKLETLKYRQQAGITLKGIAKNTLTGGVIGNGEITLAIQKDDEVAFLTQKTDESGRYTFPGLLFNDTALIHVQAKSEAGKMNADVEIEPVFIKFSPSGSQLKSLTRNTTETAELSLLKYQIQQETRKFKSDNKKIRSKSQLEKDGDGHFRLYESADYVLVVDDFEQSYDNLLDYMAGKVPGVDINGNSIRIRGTTSYGTDATPLFLIDGMPLVGNTTFNLPKEVTQETDAQGNVIQNNNEQLVQSVRAIPMSDIDKIEVLKSPQNMAVFGTKGSNGVIAIYTRKGKVSGGKLVTKGIIEHKIVGYAKYREYYMPRFTPENIASKQPDLKTLLYWNPDVITKNGNAELRFFSSDQPGKYKVVIEGVASDGRICAGSSTFEIE